MDLDHDACYRAISTRDARFDGRLFVAVKTTGIYCRPVCPARIPKRENVTFHPTAASAHEAGFRPCLRCRPEAAPDLAAWRGTSNTVSRALSLIEMGVMDGGDVTGLADRLGVGERQLRRLFRRHLGASPITVAQTRRVLLAKQLIHETKLPMTEVALAAGFGSARRFNQIFQQLYGRPPSALRRSAAEDVSSESTGGVRILLPYRPPYDWDAMLDFLRFRAIPSVETISGDAYARAIEIEGAQGIVVVRPTNSHALEATIRFPKLSSLPAIIARLRRVFDLAADPGAIGAHLARDSALAAFVKARPGLRVPGAWDGFELAVRALLGQQITVTAGIALAGKLVAAHGKALRTRHPDFPALTHVFPQPSRIANADISKLGMPRRRAAALSSLAAAVVADPHIFGARRSLDEAIVQLRSLAGVGEWTAQYIAMRELREPDAFPAADIGLMRAMQDSAGRRPSPNELLARAERWRPWRAYAAQYLWSAKAPATVTKLRSEPGDRHRNRRKAEAEWAVDA
ncbi:DNA-3-methyladenine glycosylase 2 family protein [Bradyrhizobium sp. LMTR 3]|uniref:DNA-3-methyladenine glycosylase 2 family protein n=1 Tax=Bradyrhizobium sp. LMTR 3 TaxID=189873 RepID=UPI000810C1F8|nr:3-methyladenine DNA glycosylase 2 [Bradyrhizobium sp. LMTR 3]